MMRDLLDRVLLEEGRALPGAAFTLSRIERHPLSPRLSQRSPDDAARSPRAVAMASQMMAVAARR